MTILQYNSKYKSLLFKKEECSDRLAKTLDHKEALEVSVPSYANVMPEQVPTFPPWLHKLKHTQDRAIILLQCYLPGYRLPSKDPLILNPSESFRIQAWATAVHKSVRWSWCERFSYREWSSMSLFAVAAETKSRGMT